MTVGWEIKIERIIISAILVTPRLHSSSHKIHKMHKKFSLQVEDVKEEP